MTKNIILVLSAIALIGIGLLIGVYGVGNSFGATSYDVSDLVGDVYQGKNHTLIFRDGIFQGAPISSLNVIGAATIGSTLDVTGALISGAFTQGGGINATSTSGVAVPLLASNFDTENVIDVTLNVQDATLSFPASSTLTSFIPSAGQTRTLFVRNATTTAAMDLTISGGTGVLLKMASSTNVAIIPGDTDGSNYAKLELIRKADTDIELLLSIFND